MTGVIVLGFGVAFAVIANILFMILFSGSIEGTREGTLIAVVGTGFVVEFFRKWLTSI